MRVVSLDPDGTIADWFGVVVAASTGVVYEQQCGGTACLNRSIEGFYVPVGRVDVGGETEVRKSPGWRELQEFFLRRVGIESPMSGPSGWGDSGALAELYRLVGSIPWWEQGGAVGKARRMPLAIDGTRETEIVEGWIPVLLSDDGVGVLVWPNSD